MSVNYIWKKSSPIITLDTDITMTGNPYTLAPTVQVGTIANYTIPNQQDLNVSVTVWYAYWVAKATIQWADGFPMYIQISGPLRTDQVEVLMIDMTNGSNYSFFGWTTALNSFASNEKVYGWFRIL